MSLDAGLIRNGYNLYWSCAPGGYNPLATNVNSGGGICNLLAVPLLQIPC